MRCRLFTQDREFLPGLPPLGLAKVRDPPRLVDPSGPAGPTCALIEADVLARTEIDCFNPHVLLVPRHL